MITSNILDYKKYFLNSNFEIALNYLITENLTDLPYGKHQLNNSIYIIKETYATRIIGETFWEAHEQFIDIQYILNGEEKIAYSPLKYLDEVMYHDEKDLKVLKGKITSLIHLKKNDFAIFFPEDAHMPGLNPNGLSLEVEKIVIKIKV